MIAAQVRLLIVHGRHRVGKSRGEVMTSCGSSRIIHSICPGVKSSEISSGFGSGFRSLMFLAERGGAA